MKSLSTYMKILCLVFVLCSDSLPAQWKICREAKNIHIVCLAADGDKIFAGTNKGVIYYSPDDGANWKTENGPVSDGINSLAASGGKLYAGTKNGVFVSKNEGRVWTSINNGLLDTSIMHIAIADGNILAATYSGINLSTNEGVTWTKVLNLKSGQYMSCFSINGPDYYAGSMFGGIFKSTDKGKNWTEVDLGLETKLIISLGAIGDNIIAGTAQGILLSTNKGLKWREVLNTGNDYGKIAISGNNCFITRRNGGVYVSIEDGTIWTKVSDGLNINYMTYISCMAANGNTIFSGTSDGNIYKADVEDLTGVEDLPKTSSSTLLIPNPAQNTLNIRLDKESAVATSVRVLDVCGRTVAESQIPAGSMELTLDVKELPVGIYLLNLVTGNEVKTEKFGVWR